MTIVCFGSLHPVGVDAGPAPDRIVSGDPQATLWVYHELEDGQFSAGVWKCTPGRWRIAYDEQEYCHILSGSGTLISSDGQRCPIAAGDQFVVPSGFAGEWEVIETMTKNWVVMLP